MTTPLIGVKFKTEIQATLGTGVAVTGITNANPAVASAAHSFNNGDVVVLSDILGMQEVDGGAFRVANIVAGTSFELEGVDSSNFGTFSGTGTAKDVATWNTLGFATRVDLPNAAPTELDASTLLDTIGQTVYGRPGAQSGTIDGLLQPQDTGMANLRQATRDQQNRAFRLTWANTGDILVFNAAVSAGNGFSQDNNAIATTSIAVSVKAFPSWLV